MEHITFPHTISLPIIPDSRGNITIVEANKEIPFEIKRIFYITNVPTDGQRGGHAHKTLHQFLIATSGSLDVIAENGQKRTTFSLNSPGIGLYLPPMTWKVMSNFTPGTVCLVLASNYYDESDYIRNYDDFTMNARS